MAFGLVKATITPCEYKLNALAVRFLAACDSGASNRKAGHNEEPRDVATHGDNGLTQAILQGMSR